MTIEIQAVYENGVLKPDKPLPLLEHQRVTVVVQTSPPSELPCYGVIGYTGDPEVIRKVALEPEFGVSESP